MGWQTVLFQGESNLLHVLHLVCPSQVSGVAKRKSKNSKSKNPGMRKPIDETDGKPACLYRATLGSKKISTVVSTETLPGCVCVCVSV